jgi:Zn-dependent M16 (insulinase) family peptidase
MKINSSFDLIREQTVEEINSIVFYYRHKKTGAEIISVVNNDENKVFGITFRTPPPDSTGLPHIMEHSVLCGSRKYPVKEPFVELMKGSLNSFLNAFTYPDKTCYPVASTNLQDFYNLMDVYLDSVFYPLISPFTFMQEGWHFELEDKNEEMIFKGVVFNEMKGAYSSPDDILGDESHMSLFPDTPYGFQSGGDPEVIPDLTYDQFKNFHETYYHPSNSRIFYYGDDDPDKRLELIDEYLINFDHKKVNSEIPLQTKFSKPIRKVIPYDSGESGDSAKAYVKLNWMLSEGDNPELVLGLGILSHVLLGTPAAPLRKILIESGLGEDIVGNGIEDEFRQLSFSTGLRGVEVEKVDDVEHLILSTLEEIAKYGIDPKTIEASLNTVEFSLRENNTGSFPRGLLIMLRSLSAWLYGRDPIEPLRFQEPLNAIKNKIRSGENYFEELINTFINGNSHRVTIILTPDPELGNKRTAKETLRLKNARNSMSATEIDLIIENSIELKRRQDTPDSVEALSTIPVLDRDDIDPQSRSLPNELVPTSHGKLLFHDLFTSDILYFDVGFDLKTLSPHQLPYMRLFSRSLLEMGTQKEDFVSLIQRIGRETGGVHHSLYTSDQTGTKEAFAYLFLRSKAMIGQAESLLALLTDILLYARFDDKERFRQMILEEKSSLEAGLTPSGHRVVNNRIRAQFSESAWATEKMSGIDYLFFIRDLIENLDNQWEMIMANMESIRLNLISQSNIVCNVTVDQSNWQAQNTKILNFIDSFPNNKRELKNWNFTGNKQNEGLTIPSQVNFVGMGANIYDLGYQHHGSINVITQYLRSTWLWEKVRVSGGAYGGFCAFDRLSGIFTFLSYRDPNLKKTIEYYKQTSDFLKSMDIDQSELNKSIIGAIGEIDSYQLPDAKGYTAMLRYLLNISDEERQIIRDQLLETNSSHFRDFAKVLKSLNLESNIVVLGALNNIESANQENGYNLQLKNIL